MNVVIASDHGGFQLKQFVVAHLQKKGFNVADLGPNNTDSCDYPDYAEKVCAKIQAGEADWGVLVCGTGIGMSITANKFNGIRAAVISDCFCAAATKEHNNSNVLCLGERVIGIGLAQKILDTWCAASFEGGRHQRRLDKLHKMEGR
jgi:ribose 5-phosphate isomerase B